MSFKNDNEYGLEQELIFKYNYHKALNITLKGTINYCHYDFVDCKNRTVYELKARKNNLSTYPTTLIGEDKIRYFKKIKNSRVALIFIFRDGTYYIRLEDLKINENCHIDNFRRNSRSDFNDKEKLYYHIKIEALKPIELLYEELKKIKV